MTPRLLISPFHDPYLNLAIENSLLDSLKPEDPLLFLYINAPSVVIGRFQNPWVETNPSELGTINLVRRQSGGGTVYHDQGNLNFSFLTGQEEYDKTENLKVICRVLKEAGITLSINGRHDLTATHRGEIFKVSGSAFRLRKDRVFHHGTLLIDSETSILKKAITPLSNRKFLNLRGTDSVRSRVINLSEIKPGLTVEKVINTFKQLFPPSPMDWEALAHSEPVQEERDTITSEDWILGKTPSFQQDISAAFPGKTELQIIEVKKGIIHGCSEELDFLNGIPYGRKQTRESLSKAMAPLLDLRAGDELFRRLFEVIR